MPVNIGPLSADQIGELRPALAALLQDREEDPSERLYQTLGWQRAGAIPRWARSADGTLHTTVFYYRVLDEA